MVNFQLIACFGPFLAVSGTSIIVVRSAFAFGMGIVSVSASRGITSVPESGDFSVVKAECYSEGHSVASSADGSSAKGRTGNMLLMAL